MNQFSDEYLRRINRVQDYIETNYGKTLTIDELAEVARFSKFHFCRIFQALLHEPVSQYVNRIRLENALFLLAHRLDKNITDIAYELGFSDSAVFSRAFSKHYGVSPKSYRKNYSKNCKEKILLSNYNKPKAKKKDISSVKGDFKLVTLDAMKAIYVRHTGTYAELAKRAKYLWKHLLECAKKQGVEITESTLVFSMYHDNPEFGKETQFRTSCCISVPKNCDVHEDGDLGVLTVEGGLYAVGHFAIRQSEYSDAWDYMYQEWIAGSGYVPRNYSPFEVYLDSPDEKPNAQKLHNVDIYLPVEKINL